MRLFNLIAVVTSVVAFIVVPGAAAQPQVTHVLTDQATVEVDWLRPGLQFGMNAWSETTIADNGTRITTSGANGFVLDLDVHCDESGCGSGATWYADCRPTGNDQYDFTLPDGALRFSGSGRAALRATFDCESLDVPLFQFSVDISWNANTPPVPGGQWGFEPPLTPMNGGAGERMFYVPVPVSGTASDGAAEYVMGLTTGAIVHTKITTISG
jgi:hypothetical protein